MYLKKPVISNAYDFRILLAINTEEMIVKDIVKKVGSYKHTIRRQIKTDLKKDFLIEKVVDKRKKTIYSIRWEKIVEEFLRYIKKTIQEKELSKELKEEFSKQIISIKQNKFLILALKIMFKEFSKVYIKGDLTQTLEDLFKETIVNLSEKLSPDNIKHNIFIKLKDNKEFTDFIKFNNLLGSLISPNKINLDNVFYEELEK